jgi:hypothetical protein
MRSWLYLGAAGWLMAAGPALAAEPIKTGEPVTASRASGRIVLDGKLDEPDWRTAQSLESLLEYWPGDLTPPAEHTAIRFLYDDRYLYVAFRCDLKDISKLRKPFVRRDKVNSTLDYIQVYLDPLGGRRSAYLFRVGAEGSRADGYQDEAKQTETTDPDYDWDVHTSIDAKGWTAELRIPLTTLRISQAGSQKWSMLVTRGVPRKDNTQLATAPFPHNASCFLCRANTLTLPDLTPKTDNLLITPRVSAVGARDQAPFAHADRFAVQPSLDVKWLPYAGAALDLTVKPDFSQVEADQAQLTSNVRFAISLPEKRPFFREGVDLTSLPIPAIYTRTVSAPVWGVRFTHRSEDLNATAFAARDTGRAPIVEPGFLFSEEALPDFNSRVAFARARQSLGAFDAGGVVISKRNTDGSFNTVTGADGVWGSSTDRVTAQLLQSWTREPNRPDLLPAWTGQSVDGLAALAQWDHAGPSIISTVRYSRYDDGFRSWLGYVPRVGYQDAYVKVQNTRYLKDSWLIEVGPYAGFERIEGLDQKGHEGGVFFGSDIQGPHNLILDLGLYPKNQVLTVTGEERTTSYAKASLNLNPSGWLPLITATATAGQMIDFATGEVVDGMSLDSTVRVRPVDRLEIEGRLAGTRLGGLNATHLAETVTGVTATWFFNARFYALVNWQEYRSDRRFPVGGLDRSTLASLQFSWEPTGSTGVYWGVRSAHDMPYAGPHTRSTEVYLKLSRTFGTHM